MIETTAACLTLHLTVVELGCLVREACVRVPLFTLDNSQLLALIEGMHLKKKWIWLNPVKETKDFGNTD